MSAWILGQLLEPALGSRRFAALYFTALLSGSFGALLQPDALTVGASGAVFGLMGAARSTALARRQPVADRHRGADHLNLVLLRAPGISMGGHIGGLIGGALAGLAFEGADRTAGRGSARPRARCSSRLDLRRDIARSAAARPPGRARAHPRRRSRLGARRLGAPGPGAARGR